MKIFAQQNGSYTKQELLDLSTLLIKGGYTVRRGKQKVDGKPVEFVEFYGDEEKTSSAAAAAPSPCAGKAWEQADG